MSRFVPGLQRAVTALAIALCLAAGPLRAQQGEIAPQPADTGEIDGDLAGVPAAPQGMRYDPGVLEAYQQQVEAYRQRLAAEAEAQKARAELFHRQQEAYRRELAAVQAARRQYEADRADYEAKVARRR